MASEDDYNPGKPLVIKLEYGDGVARGYQPLVIPEAERTKIEFKLPAAEAVPTVESLSELFLPDYLIETIVKHTNQYSESRMPEGLCSRVNKSEICNFLAMYYYMGVVKLPERHDYWAPTRFWPVHPICSYLSRDRFDYIWRNLHLVAPVDQQNDDEEIDLEDEGDEDEELQVLEHLPWFSKCSPILDHTNSISKELCTLPGFCLSIDEQMKKFKGRSSPTVRMTNTPITEGYKFFALCDAKTGYVWDFIPNGRLEKATIHGLVMTLADTLPDTKKYVIAMDDYFTLSSVIQSLRAKNIAAVGPARGRPGWPPKEIKDVNDGRFNTFYLLPDAKNFLICRWVNNNVVNMVTTLHTGHETVESDRRRPRKTSTNQNHIDTVWGQNAVKRIEIPKVIDDYNQFMLGVDKSDQLIADYRPSIKCSRIWMPILFHCLDILRVNAYVVSCEVLEETLTHQEFVERWVEVLFERAMVAKYQNTRASAAAWASKPPSPKKRLRQSVTNPQLPPGRFDGSPDDHHAIVKTPSQQRGCHYCHYLAACDKRDQREPVRKIKKVYRYCFACDVPLCQEHHEPYHAR